MAKSKHQKMQLKNKKKKQTIKRKEDRKNQAENAEHSASCPNQCWRVKNTEDNWWGCAWCSHCGHYY